MTGYTGIQSGGAAMADPSHSSRYLKAPKLVALFFSCVLLLIAVLGATGCSRTVHGGFVDSPDKKYRFYGRVYGAYGRSFLENTAKTVWISIVANDANETLLFRKEYRVNGSDVGWDATWDNQDNLTVVIYDYGIGVESADAKK